MPGAQVYIQSVKELTLRVLAFLFYRRPTLRQLQLDSQGRAIPKDRRPSVSTQTGIPSELELEPLLAGRTCSPLHLSDFARYMTHVEYNVENLQFWMFYHSYVKTFDALSDTQKSLAPPYEEIEDDRPFSMKDYEAELSGKRLPAEPEKSRQEKGYSWEMDFIEDFLNLYRRSSSMRTVMTKRSPSICSTIPESIQEPGTPPNYDARGSMDWSNSSLTMGRTPTMDKSLPSSPTMVNVTPVKVGKRSITHRSTIKRQTQVDDIQPLRKELNAAVQMYLVPSASMELNLPFKMQQLVCKQIRATTNPASLEPVAQHVYQMMYDCVHPNFIRYAICNANRPRTLFALAIGIFASCFGLLLTVLALGLHWKRSSRLIALPFIFLGIATLVANRNGSCIVLQATKRVQLRPYDLFDDDVHSALESAWQREYAKRPLFRRICDRQMWIEDATFRAFMDRLLWQAVAWGVIGALLYLMITYPIA